jgi:uncharacterized membrane protein YadS
VSKGAPPLPASGGVPLEGARKVLTYGLLLSGAFILLCLAIAALQVRSGGLHAGRLWLAFTLAILLGWLLGGWIIYDDPDRMREGADYWALAVPIFVGGSALLTLPVAYLLAWLTTRNRS